MPKETITMQVPAATARAYKQASATQRRRAESALALSLQTPDQAAEELKRILNKMSATARQRGLTEEKLHELLDEDSLVNDESDAE